MDRDKSEWRGGEFSLTAKTFVLEQTVENLSSRNCGKSLVTANIVTLEPCLSSQSAC